MTVDGQSFRDWFIYDYMISNETLLHKNPATGEPQIISLGWMDDSMQPTGPTEEDSNYIADCGFSPEEMADQVGACVCRCVLRHAVIIQQYSRVQRTAGRHQLVTTGAALLAENSELLWLLIFMEVLYP